MSANRQRHFMRTAAFFVIILFCAVVASAQIAGGLGETTNTRFGGNNYIVGTVYAPSGSPINTRMRIRLMTPAWGDLLATTDDAGRFVFSGVGGGTYTLIIDEKEFEPVRQEVDIIRPRSNPPETYTLTIRLRFNDKSRKKKPLVVDVSNAAVPKPAMDLYQKASTLAQANDFKGAIEQLKLAVEAYPNFVNALNQIGVLYLKQNDLKMAIEAFESALKVKPDAYEPLLNRAIVLFRLSRFEDARAALGDVIKVKPESAVAYYYLGRTLNKLKKDAEAETAYLTSIKISPTDFPETYRLLAAIYLNRGALEPVVENLETYLKLVPKTPDAENLRRVIEQSKSRLKGQGPPK